ncbi:Uncharacterised protein [Legionella lansingensis]|uniref:Uncharacterized protein n=1 Tax=Legionella lansingensis TaxID=45067 RepID=A0A0W0VGY9_9GAMM|nr:hypothetical protein Llan_2159 [Legionella lansingensis]SNV50443.1 Uncharacterised protein [Legionella lansingensis]
MRACIAVTILAKLLYAFRLEMSTDTICIYLKYTDILRVESFMSSANRLTAITSLESLNKPLPIMQTTNKMSYRFLRVIKKLY